MAMSPVPNSRLTPLLLLLALLAVVSPLLAQPSPQTLTFAPRPLPAWLDTPVRLEASASSGLPVSFSVLYGPASIDGDLLTVRDLGRVMITAVQPGNADFAPVSQVFLFDLGQPAGSVVAWGDNTYGQAQVPEAVSNAVAVAAGGEHNLALRSDGSVYAWGNDRVRQCRVPSNATNVVAIAAGGVFSVALRADGTAIHWGDFYSFGPQSVVAISAGPNHLALLRTDGRVEEIASQWGVGARLSPLENTNVVAICAGGRQGAARRTVAITANGDVIGPRGRVIGGSILPSSMRPTVRVGLGDSLMFGLLPDGLLRAYGHGPSLILPLSQVVDLAAFRTNLLVLHADGSVRGFGVQEVVASPPDLRDAVAVAVGERHGIAIVGDGSPCIVGPIRFRPLASMGQPLPLAVRAAGAQPMSFAWLANGVPIPGADSAAPTIPALWRGDTNEYRVVVSNERGSVTTAALRIPVSTVSAWGGNTVKQLEITSTVTNPLAISGGALHSLALQPDGSVVAWGKQIRLNLTTAPPVIPLYATNLFAVAAGGTHSVALQRDGGIIAWGDNGEGQTNAPQVGDGITVAAGWAHSVVLRANGSLAAWGSNEYGQAVVPAEATNLITVAAGYYHNLAIRDDRSVAGWGWESDVPDAATNVVAVAAGWRHSLAARADGTVVAWGDNSYGQANVPADATNAIAVAAGFYHSLALRDDGTVVAWGTNFHGVTTVPTGLRDVVTIHAGEDFNVALSRPGVPTIGNIVGRTNCPLAASTTLSAQIGGSYPLHYQWLRDGVPLPGETARYLQRRNVNANDAGLYTLQVSNSFGVTISEGARLNVQSAPYIASRSTHLTRLPGQSVCVSAEVFGEAPISYQWFLDGRPLSNGPTIAGAQEATLCLNSPSRTDNGLLSLRASNSRGFASASVAVLSVTPIAAWGDNTYGQLEIPPMTNSPIAIAAGDSHNLALRDNGSIVAWGENEFGQCDVPTPLMGATAIAAGRGHSVALLATGGLIGWGDNRQGQVTIPASATNVLAIAAGGNRTMAMLADGRILTWGEGVTASAPPASSNAIAMAMGAAGVLVLAADASLVQWGSMVQPPESQGFAAVAVGDGHFVGAKEDGDVVVWGDNWYGQGLVPDSATDVVAVAAGGDSSLALRRDGTLVAWGDPSFSSSQIPPLPRQVIAISKGSLHSLALLSAAAEPRPFLSTFFNQGEVGVTWRVSGVPFQLQWTASLDPGAWRDVIEPPRVQDGVASVVITPGSSQMFFRLRR